MFQHHQGGRYPFFLDRGHSGTPSFAGSDPVTQLVVEADGTSRVWNGASWLTQDTDPLLAIDRFVADGEVEQPNSIADGAAAARTVGFLSYELGSFIERVDRPQYDPVGLPLAVLSTYNRVDMWDPVRGSISEIVFRSDEQHDGVPAGSVTALPYGAQPDNTEGLYRSGFRRILQAIASGEIYQANLSRRLRYPTNTDAWGLFRRLRREQPVPQGAFLDFGDFQLLSNSPETFLRVSGDDITTFPIKGTRPRSGDDPGQIEELANDPKEKAEHVMIVDLERNDLGRICRTGSVQVLNRDRVATFATLHHLVSDVHGQLRPEIGIHQILRACFPGGSITGAPKIKAMEIIAEVERSARGIYTGAIGCFNGARSLDLNIAIRTAVNTPHGLFYSSGGGVVADSSEAGEYTETSVKAEAFQRALGVAAPRETDGQHAMPKTVVAGGAQG